MPEHNAFFYAIFAIVVGFYLFDLVAVLLNRAHADGDLPEEFNDTFDAGEYSKNIAYSKEGSRFEIFQDTFGLILFIAFWLCGGFAWMCNWAEGFGHGPVVTGLIVFAFLTLAQTLIGIPFEIYDTFVIEEKYGFNKTTPKTFVLDHIKNLGLGALLGLPIIALLLWLFGRFDNAWMMAWAAVVIFMLIVQFIAPKYIMPLYNKFEPLEDEELKKDINAMAERCEFPLTEISVMDGSRRSAKSNAFFSGFGKNKKIALYDTLVESQTRDELVAVLAHEIGHFRLRHIIKMMVVGFASIALMFFLLSLFLKNFDLSAAFGLETPRVFMSFLFFGILFKPIGRITSVISSVLSRKHEFEADAYAAEKTGNGGSLISALKKLSKKNLSNLTPHPLYVFLFHSHPPVLERVQALRKIG